MGQTAQLPGHEIHHVFGVILGADARQIPAPSRCARVEHEQPLLGQCRQELDCEERIAPGLLVHEFCQGPGGILLAMQGIGYQPAHIVELKRNKHDFLHVRSGLTDYLKGSHQRMRGADHVVRVGADQQEVPKLPLGD